MRRAFLVLVLLTLSLTFPAIAAAQISADGSIRGLVTDSHGAILPGVLVTLAGTGTSVSGQWTTTTDIEGVYRFPNVRPGDYVVSAELQGFSKMVRPGIVMRAGLNLSIDLTLQVGQMTETVQVTADAPLLESESSQQAINLDGELKRRLPLSASRDWNDILVLLPGAVGTNGAGLSVHGSVYEAHVMMVDGADLAPAGQNLTSLMNLSAEAFQDVQVKSGANSASTPLGLGAVINVATRSGTNTLSGGIGMVYQSPNWYSRGDRTGTINNGKRVQPDMGGGGPIIKDKLFWFGSYRFSSTEFGVSRSESEIALFKQLDPNFTPVNNVQEGHIYSGKITGRMNQNHQFQGLYQYDKTPQSGVQFNHLQQFTETKTGGPAYSASVNSVWSSSFTTRFNASYNAKVIDIDMLNYEHPQRPIYQTIVQSGITVVGNTLLAYKDNSGQTAFLQPYEKVTLTADATYYKRGWFGTHEFQTGIYAQPYLHIEIENRLPGNGFSMDEQVLLDPNNPAGGYRSFHRRYVDSDATTFQAKDGSDYAVYIQDNWRPHARLTINAGLRIDRIQWKDQVFDLETQKSVEIGPRLGGVYALDRERKNIVRGSFAILHAAPSGNYAPDAGGQNFAGRKDEYDFDGDGVFETSTTVQGLTALGLSRSISPDFHQPFTREFVVGYRRQFPGLISVDVSAIRREFRDRATAIETNYLYEGSVWKGLKNPDFTQLFLITNNEWNWQVYKGLEFSFTKQTQQWNVIASYSRQFRHLEGTWQPGDPGAIIDPTAFATNKHAGRPQTSPNNTTEWNSLSTAHMSPDLWGNMWQDHVAKVAFVWFAPWNMVISNNYIYNSGPWSGPIFDQLAAADPQYGPTSMQVTNSSGVTRTVANPLATTLRWAFDTRGDGQFTPDAQHVWNIRVGRDFPLTDGRRIELAADFLNVANFNKETGFASGFNLVSSPNYRKTQGSQAPRTFQGSIRFAF